jgi:hypothetical protein
MMHLGWACRIHSFSLVCIAWIELTVDAYAEKVDAQVYIPDFFDGEHIPFDHFSDNEVKMDPNYDLMAFLDRHSRRNKLSAILQAVRDIKSLPSVAKLGVIGVTSPIDIDVVLLGRLGIYGDGITSRSRCNFNCTSRRN